MIKFIFISIIISCNCFAQYQAGGFNISLNANYTTTAKVYLNPNSDDIDLKNRSMPLDDIFSPSLDIRYELTDDILLALNMELIEKTRTSLLRVASPTGTLEIEMQDGLRVIPFEFSLHYLIPFSTEKFKFLIGGGLGYYYGWHIREYGSENVSNEKRDFAYGIHVSVSSDYMINDFFSIRGEMKFRDPEYNVTSTYNKLEISYNGEIVSIPESNKQFDSKINIDGITFTLGAAFHF